jgi:macrolide-specific efflux system membrane fusion protein
MAMGVTIAIVLLSTLEATGQTGSGGADPLVFPPDPTNRSEGTEAGARQVTFADARTVLMQNTLVSTPIAGVVASVDVREGDRVTADSTLLRIRGDLAEQELLAAKASLDVARLESASDIHLRSARRMLDLHRLAMRQSRLANETYPGVVSDMELEKIQLDADRATLTIEQAEHQQAIAAADAVAKAAAVAIAQTRRDRHTLRAGVTGMVAEVGIEPGEWTAAGHPIIRILSLDPIRIECFIDGQRHGRELIGRDVVFVPDGERKKTRLKGKITFVSPERDPVSGQVRLWATMNNPDGRVGSGVPGELVIP